MTRLLLFATTIIFNGVYILHVQAPGTGCPSKDGTNLDPCICTGSVCLGGGDDSSGNVFVDGKPICDDFWEDTDASVLCRQLGFCCGEATVKATYGQVLDDFIMDDVDCNGTEINILHCKHEKNDDCGAQEGAEVKCAGNCDIEGYKMKLKKQSEKISSLCAMVDCTTEQAKDLCPRECPRPRRLPETRTCPVTGTPGYGDQYCDALNPKCIPQTPNGGTCQCDDNVVCFAGTSNVCTKVCTGTSCSSACKCGTNAECAALEFCDASGVCIQGVCSKTGDGTRWSPHRGCNKMYPTCTDAGWQCKCHGTQDHYIGSIYVCNE